MIGRVYLDPGDRLSGHRTPPEPVTVVTKWGPGGGPRNVAVRRRDGSTEVIPFTRRLRRPLALTAADAEWIRDNVWTPAMRKLYRELPGYWLVCACQYTADCWCGHCPRGEPLARPIGTVLRPGGAYSAFFSAPYAHPTPTAVGPQRTTQAQVWYADRRCRWLCPCDCHQAATPAAATAAPEPGSQAEAIVCAPPRRKPRPPQTKPSKRGPIPGQDALF